MQVRILIIWVQVVKKKKVLKFWKVAWNYNFKRNKWICNILGVKGSMLYSIRDNTVKKIREERWTHSSCPVSYLGLGSVCKGLELTTTVLRAARWHCVWRHLELRVQLLCERRKLGHKISRVFILETILENRVKERKTMNRNPPPLVSQYFSLRMMLSFLLLFCMTQKLTFDHSKETYIFCVWFR